MSGIDAKDWAALESRLVDARDASRTLADCAEDTVVEVLDALASKALARQEMLLAANRLDLARMDEDDPKYDRLLLTPARLEGIAADLRAVARLPAPVGEVLEQRTLESGLALSKVRVPIGVVGVIFESRPNVTFDVFALCLKTRNACVLKGSSDARDTNAFIVGLVHETLADHGLDPAAVLLAPPERAWLPRLLHAVGLIDVAIPRGSRGLIDFVRENARIPVIETGAGIVHTYVDASADLEMAARIVTNAKSRRVSVCNALDTLVLHRALLPVLPSLLHELGEAHGCEVFADEPAYEALDGRYAGPLHPAEPRHYGREFLSMRLSVKTVEGLDAALEHIRRHSSMHSEAVVATDEAVVERFLASVDAAVVYANASTAFTDGAEFGMGAEIGISTQKLHARGPMALPELTSYKWVARGSGQVRPAG